MGKKIIAIMISSLMMLTACGQEKATVETSSDSLTSAVQTEAVSETSETQSVEAGQTEDSATAEADKPENDTNILVVYFSRTGEQYNVGNIDKGNTAIVADMIVDKTGADSFEILPVDDYPYKYLSLTAVAKKEQSENARPAYSGEVPDLSQYDTVFFGAPVWWGDWPMIMYTFFENNADALAGKTLIPFSTHEGSGLSGFDTKLANACPNSSVGTGLAIQGKDAQDNQNKVRESVNNWLTGLGY